MAMDQKPTLEELKAWKEALEKKAKEAREKQKNAVESDPQLVMDHVEMDNDL